MKNAAIAASAVLALTATGCINDISRDPETGLFVQGSEQDPVIVDAVNWVEVTSLPEGSPARENSRAVGHLSIPSRGTRCTAFLISNDVVMTNQHCITAAWAAEGATVSFRREAGVPFFEWATYDCSTFLGNDRSLDFALLRCSGNPGATHGVIELEARDPAVGHDLYVIHQNCDYYASPNCAPTKKYSPGRVTRVDSEIRHDADTLGGSSGSPVFSATSHRVFALHHVGVGNNGNGRGTANYAVPMSDILPVLESRFPDIVLGGGDPQQQTPGPAGDAFEPNDSFSNAAFVSLPFGWQELVISSAIDEDFFVFETNGATHAISIDFSHAQGDLDLYVYDASGNEVARSVSVTDGEEIARSFAAGRYIVRVHGYRGATGTYSISIQ